MCVNRSALLSGGLDFHALIASPYGVVGIDALDDEVGVSVEVGVLGEDARMLGKAGGYHVREDAGHDGGTQHIVETLQAFFGQVRVDVVEEVVHVLHRGGEVHDAEFVG